MPINVLIVFQHVFLLSSLLPLGFILTLANIFISLTVKETRGALHAESDFIQFTALFLGSGDCSDNGGIIKL